jgi:hypothetical protein
MKILCSIYPNVNASLARSVRELCRRAEEVTPVEHCLKVFLMPAPVVLCTQTGRRGYGLFRWGKVHRAEIFLGDGRVARGLKLRTRMRLVRSTFAHELAHYEQWRDGRRMTERGVAVRARTLEAALTRRPPRPRSR